MKKYFFTGLALLLPMMLTLFILSFLFNLITTPLLGLTTLIMSSFEPFHNHHVALLWVSRILSVILLFLLILFVGYLGQWFIFSSILGISEKILLKIPLAGPIYNSLKDLVNSFMGDAAPDLKDAVLVPFPSPEVQSVAFVTGQEFYFTKEKPLVTLFVPTPPNPFLGVLLLVPKENLIPVNLPKDQVMKFVGSCGIILSVKCSS